ncbi:MAG: F0F1 ATP synthase subunit delta [Candidatus Eutrophobiaceae bacterium]
MLENATIARPYAEAVFAQAQQDDRLAEWGDLLAQLGAVTSDPRVRLVLQHPLMDNARKRAWLAGFFPEDLDRVMGNFLAVLTDAGRLNVAAEIAGLFEQLRAQAEGVATVSIDTAFPIESKQEDMFRELLGRRLGKRVSLIICIDDELIGGVVIRMGDAVIDASVRGHLQKLQSILAH